MEFARERGRDGATVLVVGFPRWVARLACEAVLDRGDGVAVALLVERERVGEAEAYVRELRARREGGAARAARVRVLEGAPWAIDLGLSGREFNALAAELTEVLGLGAELASPGGVDDAAHAGACKLHNVDALRELLSLARAAPRLRRLLWLSSVAVFGDATGVAREDELERGQRLRDPVEATLYRAERLARAAMSELPVTVARAGLVVGHSQTGVVDALVGPYLPVLLAFTAPVEMAIPLPRGRDARMNLVPVDFVARACVALAFAEEALGGTFHLVDPAPLPARRAYELAAQAAGRRVPRGFIPANLTRAVLRAPGLERFVRSPRAFLEKLATGVSYSSVRAREVLQPRGVECPPFEQYVDALVGHVRDRMALRQRAREESAGSSAEVEDPLA